MNFKEKLAQGKQGSNFGLPMGLPEMDKVMGGVQKAALYGIAASPKGGKTTLCDFAFLIHPYLYYLKVLKEGNPLNLEVEWIYFSFEISRIQKEFKFVAFFMVYDYNISTFKHKGKTYNISPNYLMGKMKDDEGEAIIISDEHEKLVLDIYQDRIIPMFGEYNSRGEQIKKGVITFVEGKDNPTGIRNFIGIHSTDYGEWLSEEYMHSMHDQRGNPIEVKREKKTGFIPNNPNKYTIIITDHLRKVKKERGFSLKESVDKLLEYQVEFRNWAGFTFVDIIHLNRSMSDTERIKYMKEFLYPTGDDIKDTGNLSEDADYILTMFDPNDEKFNITKHFGLEIKDRDNYELYPGLRSIHLVESRDTECPVHFRAVMKGHLNTFESVNTGYGA